MSSHPTQSRLIEVATWIIETLDKRANDGERQCGDPVTEKLSQLWGFSLWAEDRVPQGTFPIGTDTEFKRKNDFRRYFRRRCLGTDRR